MLITPAANVPCGRYTAYTATPTSVQTARYEPTNSSTVPTRPLACAHRRTAGAAPGSIIAAIIGTHRATKNANEPSGVATPMSIPFICRTATTQDAAARPSVAVSTAPVAAVLVLVMAAVHHLPSYSSWRRHQTPVSLRPLGARSSHWY